MGRDVPTEEKGSIKPRDRNITFQRGTDFVVPYVEENINRCRCPQCPVQANSRCAQSEVKIARQALENAPAGRFQIQRTFREFIAQKVRPHVRTLTLKDNAFAVHVRSGRNMISKMQTQTITSVSTAEQLDFSLTYCNIFFFLSTSVSFYIVLDFFIVILCF
jgi:hypothetical protein